MLIAREYKAVLCFAKGRDFTPKFSMMDLPQNGETWSYEATVDRLEAIIDRVESGELPLEEVFEQFAIAAECLQECERFLVRGKEQMQLSIELLAAEPDF